MDEMHLCLMCGKPVPDYEPIRCCNGADCSCMGLPIEPCVCSDKCYSDLMKGKRDDLPKMP